MSKIRKQVFSSRTRLPRRLRRTASRRGQTLVEYALIIAVISIVSIGVLINLGQNVKNLYTVIDSEIQRAPGGVNAGP